VTLSKEIILLFVSFISIILTTLIGLKGVRQKPWKLFLWISLAIIGLRFFVRFAMSTGLVFNFPHLFRLNTTLGVFTPPAIYLFLHYLVFRDRRLSAKSLIHLILPIGVFIYMLPFYLLPASQKLEYLNHEAFIDVSVLPYWYNSMGLFYSFFYLSLIVFDFIAVYKNNSTATAKKLSQFIVPALSISIIGYVVFTAFLTIKELANSEIDFLFVAYLSLSIVVISGFILIVKRSNPFEKGIWDWNDKYSNSTVSMKRRYELSLSLNEAVVKNKLYQNEKLTLEDLSVSISAPVYVTSQVINEIFGCSFYDYINKMRVEEAKKILLNPENDHLSIEGVGYEVGFNSRASFYKSFRKYTNTTPTRFKKQEKLS